MNAQYAKSQKIIGLRQLYNVFSTQALKINATLNKKDLHKVELCDAEVLNGTAFPYFARPCPLKPRHGFVESRVVSTWVELLGILRETLEAEEDGELMLTPVHKNVEHSAIWTPTLLTVGSGHDGATSGKDVMSFPLAFTGPAPVLSSALLTAAHIPADSAPYVEVIASCNKDGHQQRPFVLLTQLRAGPKLDGNCGPNYVPYPCTVSHIIPVGGSLLEWEAKMLKASQEPGTVVHHPGGSMTDHYAVHARASKIPIIITFFPVIGDCLVPSAQIEDPDPYAVLRGLIAAGAAKLRLNELNSCVHLMLLGLHNSSAMTGSHGFWIGVSAGLMLRLGSIALRGEARHMSGQLGAGSSREAVYDKFISKSLSWHRRGLGRLIRCFRYEWGVDAVTSIGGHKWAVCAMSLVPLFAAAQKLASQPSDDTVSSLIKALNVAINQEHNGGWWMNKFVHHELMNTIQNGNLLDTLRAVPAMQRMNEAIRLIQRTKRFGSLNARVENWPVKLTQHTLRVKAVKADYINSTKSMSLSIINHDTAELSCLIPLSKFQGLAESALDSLYMTQRDDGGIQLVLKVPHTPPVVLWGEKMIDPKPAVEAAALLKPKE